MRKCCYYEQREAVNSNNFLKCSSYNEKKSEEETMMQAITQRRSIRKFKETMVSRTLIEEILQAGILAPSAKNRQPWRFITAVGNAKEELLCAMREGLEREKRTPLLPENADYLRDAEHTADIMEQAPVIILVVNPMGIKIGQNLTPEQHVFELCNAQSIGAALENMIVSATELGLGSLWICNTYFAQYELNKWAKMNGEVCAALALGYADESPAARPRNKIESIVQWRY